MSDAATNPTPLSPRQSAIEELRASFKQAQANKRHDFPVPGWEGLWITCRALDDYSEVRDRVAPIAGQPGLRIAEREISAAGELILLSCVGSHIRNPDGTRLDLEAPLGVELCQTLLGDGESAHAPTTDTQALSVLIPSTMARVALAQQIQDWSAGAGAETENQLAGE